MGYFVSGVFRELDSNEKVICTVFDLLHEGTCFAVRLVCGGYIHRTKSVDCFAAHRGGNAYGILDAFSSRSNFGLTWE